MWSEFWYASQSGEKSEILAIYDAKPLVDEPNQKDLSILSDERQRYHLLSSKNSRSSDLIKLTETRPPRRRSLKISLERIYE